jgi:Uma2 family endonuclease
MASHPKHFHTPEEYLALERKAPFRNEYYAGDIFAMSGASRQHNIIVGNVTTLLTNQLEERDCEIYPVDMRVRTPDTTVYAYPDVSVVCGPPRFEDEAVDTLLNATVIIEVLSPSTETHDRTKKFAEYRKITSLREYILIAQHEYRVTQHIRQPSGSWGVPQEIRAPTDTLHLTSIDCDLPLGRVYRKVQEFRL